MADMRNSKTQKEIEYDCLIVGSGYSGSILSAILARQGMRVLLIDRLEHPRFAIGESSTPIADMLLDDLGNRWNIPDLTSLARYGHWIEAKPDINCGLKRGFTYFRHHRGKAFHTDDRNSNQMLVTASASDSVGDTQWYRSEVDQFLVELAIRFDVEYLSRTQIVEVLKRKDNTWDIRLKTEANGKQRASRSITASFLVDASGRSGALQQHLSLEDITNSVRTNTRTTYAHCAQVPSCQESLQIAGIDTSRHPFHCDDAAVHHLLEDGWLWMLRFRNNAVSVGRVWRKTGTSEPKRFDPKDPFDIASYPTLEKQLGGLAFIGPTDAPMRPSGRVQHRLSPVVGENWALLPSAAITLDPLHSSGIALGLAGVSRLASILLTAPDRKSQLTEYARILEAEIEFMDLLVDGAYRAMPFFDAFCSFCLIYFVGAIACEEALAKSKMSESDDSGILGPLWSSGDSGFVMLANKFYNRIVELTDNSNPTLDALTEFQDDLRRDLSHWKQATFFGCDENRMYRYTAAPKSL